MKISLGIATKLIFMMTVIIVAAISVVVYEATTHFKEDSIGRVQEMNKDFAESLGEQVYTILQQATDKMQLMTETVSQSKGQVLNSESQQLIQNILRANDELISFGVYRPDGETFKEYYFATKDEVLAEFDTKIEDLKQKSLPKILSAVLRRPEEISLINTSPYMHKAVLTIAFLTKKTSVNAQRWLIRCDLRQEPLIRLFKKRSYLTAFMIDSAGNLLVHSNPELVLNQYNMSNLEIVKKFEEGHSTTEQTRYADDQGTYYRGTYKTLGIGGAAVVAQVEEAQALAAVNDLQYQSILITVIVVGFAFIFNFVFSKSMTSPLGRLFRATEKVALGDFSVELNSNSNDEIGALTSAFKKMVVGLQERDKLKNTFSKFHSKEIAQKIMAGEIKLGGERKVATVFFSDIRNFTQMSETLTPDQVVNFLNEYMTEMVKIITKHHGVVDKYIGDAIMALWGVPTSTPNDAVNAVRAALEMRAALKALNKRREAAGKPEMAIGMGIHTGEVLAGNIGSEERLEYTVIGDTVNEASRIETANKFLFSDLLISDVTYKSVSAQNFIFGPPVQIHVKGKSAPITVYQIIGHKNADGIVETVLDRGQQESIMNGPKQLKHSEEGFENHIATTTVAQAAAPVTEVMRPAVSHHYAEAQFAAPSRSQMHQAMAPIPGGQEYRQPGVRPTVIVPPPVARETQWFLVRDANGAQPEGPYSFAEAKIQVEHSGFPYHSAFAFKQGDVEMKPLAMIAEFSRRRVPAPDAATVIIAPPPPEVVQAAQAEEWYVHREGNQTYGPYSVDQLRDTVEGGHIGHDTYVWKVGLENWIRVHEIPGFDRRADTASGHGQLQPLPVIVRKPA